MLLLLSLLCTDLNYDFRDIFLVFSSRPVFIEGWKRKFLKWLTDLAWIKRKDHRMHDQFYKLKVACTLLYISWRIAFEE